MCPGKTLRRARGCYRDVCVKSCHWRALKHTEESQQDREVEEEEEEEEEEERKSLVSSTHLSSSEYSASR